jgi:hypothetical protein
MPGGENAENNGQLCRKGSDGDRMSALEEANGEYRVKLKVKGEVWLLQ